MLNEGKGQDQGHNILPIVHCSLLLFSYYLHVSFHLTLNTRSFFPLNTILLLLLLLHHSSGAV